MHAWSSPNWKGPAMCRREGSSPWVQLLHGSFGPKPHPLPCKDGANMSEGGHLYPPKAYHPRGLAPQSAAGASPSCSRPWQPRAAEWSAFLG